MSLLQSVEFTTSGTWSVPAGISLVWVTCCGAGAGGGGSNNTDATTSNGGGGSAEWIFNTPMHVTPGGTVTVSIGVGGIPGNGGVSNVARKGGNGGATTVGTLTATGGYWLGSAINTVPQVSGGGPNGAKPSTSSTLGGASGTRFLNSGGGSAGGAGAAPIDPNGTGGSEANHVGGPQGTSGVFGGLPRWGGGGGAASYAGDGGLGMNALANPNGQSATAVALDHYGAGGGGSSGVFGSNQYTIGAAGVGGYALITYLGQ